MLLRSLLVLAILVGHGGFHVLLYNRINATGLRRRTIKTIEIGIVLSCLLLPVAMVVLSWDWLTSAAASGSDAPPPVAVLWATVSLAYLVGITLPWLLDRPLLGRGWLQVERRVERLPVEQLLGRSPAATRRCRWMSRLPANDIFQLSEEEKQLPVAGLPQALDGLRIAHLSDVHLTGEVGPEYFELAVARTARWKPDLVALTGDLIDRAECIAWLPRIFAPLAAPLGSYFLLGNHDQRVPDPDATRRQMEALHWIDVGGKAVHRCVRDLPMEILGSEVPWFGTRPPVSPDPKPFRLLLSHSPDEIAWARRQAIPLMLAGHTHGGHGRLPLIGPVLSPSRYGSRFASGEFYLPPTTLHVTRGLSGTHLMRICCPPEISLLVLRARG